MSDSSRDLLAHGVAAAKANSKNEARYFLEWLLRDETAEPDEQDQARQLLAQIADDPKEKRNWLEEILVRNPMDAGARRELAILNGDLNPADIIDPDQLPAPAEAAIPPEARRFVCGNCGGRMIYHAADGSLTCKYCGNHESLLDAAGNAARVAEQNFTIALATAKGHSVPTTTHTIQCTGCGATFQFQPEMISHTCPYCETPYALEQRSTRELIAPAGIVPFAVSREQAQRTILAWYEKNKFKILSAGALPGGVYLPVWTFDTGGTIEWSCLVEVNDHWQPESGSALADQNDLIVSASHTLSSALTKQIEDFPLDRLVPFDVRYLADWAAETYSVQVGDASLVARARVLAKTEPRIRAGILKKYQHLQFSTLRLVVESYKLALLPFWIARYRFDNQWYNVIVNGETNQVYGEKPARGLGGWFGNLFKS